MDGSFDVLVIGGGVSGLTCAKELASGGLRVAILESRERLGGRVWTAPCGDLGASWIHGANDKNPVYREAKALGAPLAVTKYVGFRGQGFFVVSFSLGRASSTAADAGTLTSSSSAT